MGERLLTAKGNIIVMCRCRDRLHLASHIKFFYAVAKIGNGWMCRIVRSEDIHGLFNMISAVKAIHYHQD